MVAVNMLAPSVPSRMKVNPIINLHNYHKRRTKKNNDNKRHNWTSSRNLLALFFFLCLKFIYMIFFFNSADGLFQSFGTFGSQGWYLSATWTRKGYCRFRCHGWIHMANSLAHARVICGRCVSILCCIGSLEGIFFSLNFPFLMLTCNLLLDLYQHHFGFVGYYASWLARGFHHIWLYCPFLQFCGAFLFSCKS